MSMITIHCRLVASEAVRRHLWYVMVQSNTPLINSLLRLVSEHHDFETWQRWGSIPTRIIQELCEPLKKAYPGQPARFYASAILMVTYTYESWLALQQNRYRRLSGKKRWLAVVKSDAELMALSGCSIEVIQEQAQKILSQFQSEDETQSSSGKKNQNKKRQQTTTADNQSLISRLFAAYDTGDELLNCAISYLIKNDGKIVTSEEESEKFAHRIRRKQKQVEQLEIQMSARLPKGRDLTGSQFEEILDIAKYQISESTTQQRTWEARLMTQPASLPYPIIYGSSTDIRWSKTPKGRITVNFSGLEKYLKSVDPEIEKWFKTHREEPFQLYCDQRQLLFFQRFAEDWKTYQANKESYPAGLLTLSSAMLAWRKGEGKGDPWNTHYLSLYCSFDTRLMTAEGTLQVQQEKTEKVCKRLAHGSADPRNQSTLNRLKNLPERPSRKLYQGKPEILVGLSLGLADPITATVVNGRTGQVLAYRTPQTLLGDRYHLLNRHRQQQQQNALQRHKNQQRGLREQPSESELGQTVDCLLANAIIQLAQHYQAGSIVFPNLTHIRELLTSEITARAEQKCPGSVEAQNRYAKDYRKTIHQWSYNRLLEAIQSKAKKLGITIESGFQTIQGISKEQAKDIAIAAYHDRTSAT